MSCAQTSTATAMLGCCVSTEICPAGTPRAGQPKTPDGQGGILSHTIDEVFTAAPGALFGESAQFAYGTWEVFMTIDRVLTTGRWDFQLLRFDGLSNATVVFHFINPGLTHAELLTTITHDGCQSPAVWRFAFAGAPTPSNPATLHARLTNLAPPP